MNPVRGAKLMLDSEGQAKAEAEQGVQLSRPGPSMIDATTNWKVML